MASGRAKAKGRGQLSKFDTLPREAEAIIAWAAAELSDRAKTQTDIYAEFVEKCEALMAEHRGELEFDIPSFSSFNRYSIRQARLTRRLDETRQIVAALSEKFDHKASDDLTILTAETIKALVLHMLGDATEGIEPLAAMQLANAFKSATQAQHISSDRTRKLNAAFEARVEIAVDTVARAKGLSHETAEEIKAKVLGVQA